MSDRIQDFKAFWPYYIGEHRNPVCRVMHFIGTGGFLLVLATCVAMEPVRTGCFVLAGIVVGFLARRIEAKRRAGTEILAIVILWLIGSPWILLGIIWAYAWAWIGHFKIEMNRPATFTYPLWSLFADFKMVSLMASGKLWTGDSIASA
ncbi:MAG: hypothetical protein CL930_00045 [Deltaproteobacteria bacterium]|nr:hypothetical protein [Deltaproteobacteria bacterium]